MDVTTVSKPVSEIRGWPGLYLGTGPNKLNGMANGNADGGEPNDDRRLAMERGQRLEPAARRAYERLFGVRVEESGLHPHPRHPNGLAASPDGIVLRPDGGLSDLLVEIKVPRENTKKGRGAHRRRVWATQRMTWHAW